MTDFSTEQQLGTFTVDGEICEVSLSIAYDGLEHVGRLWFGGPVVGQNRIPDHGIIPGRTQEEAIELAQRLTADDFLRRFFRARAEKRKFLQLRAATQTFLDKVKYMNRVAVSVQGGIMDPESARKELDLVVAELHELVDTLPLVAGVEEG